MQERKTMRARAEKFETNNKHLMTNIIITRDKNNLKEKKPILTNAVDHESVRHLITRKKGHLICHENECADFFGLEVV